jgi:hypothetical protein
MSGLINPFYISDQLAGFLREAKFEGLDSKMLELVLGEQIATSGVLVNLMMLYIKKNNLRCKSNGQRIHWDALMEKYFGGKTNTQWSLKGVLLDVKFERSNRRTDAIEYMEILFGDQPGPMERSALARMIKHAPLKGRDLDSKKIVEKPAFIEYNPQIHTGSNDDWGFMLSMVLSLVAYFRISNKCISADQQTAIQQIDTNPNIAILTRLRDHLSDMLRPKRK